MFAGLIFAPPSLAAQPQVTAPSAILYDRDTGEILFEKESNNRRPPASTTKIMTAIIAIEMGRLDEEVIVSENAASVGGTSIHLKAGEIFSYEDLLWGALLNSGNDACVALAEAAAGSESQFVQIMNQKAFLLGAWNSTFKNTNGLPREGHQSTAYDLAVIADYALDNPVFANIVGTKHRGIPKKDTTWPRRLNNTNRLLYSYPGANGVKTGTTNAAGQCLVASASRQDRDLISVVLKSANRWADSVRLLDHGFEDYQVERIPRGTLVGTLYFRKGKPYQVNLCTLEDLSFSLAGDKMQQYEKRLWVTRPILPLKAGKEVGYLEIKANKQYKIPVAAVEPVGKTTLADSIRKQFRAINEDF